MPTWNTPEARDRVIRTLIGEAAANDEGSLISVAHVLKNRADSGKYGDKNVSGAALAPKQFSMWNEGMASSGKTISPSDPRYIKAGQIADAVFGGQIPDNTGGADHYYAPSGMAGGQAPPWAAGQTPTATIGGQHFYKIGLSAADAISQPAMTRVDTPAETGWKPAASPLAPTGPAMGAVPGERPQYQHGVGTIGGQSFHWGSGTPGKYWSIPYGDYPVTPDAPTGAWAQQAGAIPLSNNVIADPLLHRNRIGIMIHSGSSANLDQLYTEGCFKVDPEDWPNVRAEILKEAKSGPLYLHIQPNGVASFTNTKTLEQTSVPTAASPAPPADSLSKGAVPANTDAAGPASSAAPAAAASIPAANSSAGFVGPGSDKYSVVQGMTSGTSHNPQLTTAANWGNLFGGAAPSLPSTQPAATPSLPSTQPASAPLPPVRPADAAPAAPIDTNNPLPWQGPPQGPAMPTPWQTNTTDANNPMPWPAAGPGHVPNWGPRHAGGSPTNPIIDTPSAAPTLPNLDTTWKPAPTMPIPPGYQPPPDQTSSLPGSMFASAQNLLKLLFPSASA